MAVLAWLGGILLIGALAPSASLAQTITSLAVRVGASADDAEEKAPGAVVLGSRDLEFTFAMSEQTVGLRFANVNIPPGATILGAHVELTVDATHSGTTILEIAGEATAHALAFASAAFDVSARPRTAAVVDWTPPPWSTVGTLEHTPDIAAIIQEVVDGPGWDSGNALAVILTGSGRREAVAYDGRASAAPLLHVEFTMSGLPTSSTTTSSSTSTTTTLPLPGGGIGTPENLAVMYIGDGPDSASRAAAIYGLATSQGVDAIVHSGDTDYGDDADTFWSRVHNHLGTAFPYFVSVGNHDDSWPDYQNGGEAQCERTPGAVCVGDYGVNSTVFYKGLTIVLSGAGTRGSGHEAYMRGELEASDSIWKICSWHVNQNRMQLGSKGDEPGWGVYDACREVGAFIVTGHEHTYSRTRTLIDMEGLVSHPGAPDPDTLFVGPGHTFVVVSGLAGATIRNQDRCIGPNGRCTTEGNECEFSTGSGCEGVWAAFYGEDQHGGLIIRYHVDGDPWKARGQFFSVDGVLRDEFIVFSEHALPTTTTSTTSATPSTTSSTTMATTTSTTLPPPPTVINVRVAASADDAEERAPGDVVLGSSDLELTFAKNEQIVGIRFADVEIPAGAIIMSAHLQFEVDATHSDTTVLEIAGAATANALPFAAINFDVSSRPRTATVVDWTPAPWSTISALELTPDIAAVIQEIVAAPGWESGNALAVIVTGSGRREAVAYDGQASAAPLLHVEYTTGGSPASSTTSTTATTSTTVTTSTTSTLAPTTTTVTTSTTSTLAPTSTTVTTSTTEPIPTTTTSTTTTLPPASTSLEVRVNASTDDAEEAPTGQMRLISSDLEFIYDTSDQTTGLRFVNVTIPPGASIVSAHVRLQVDEVSSGLATMQIAGEAVDNAATFALTFGNMTDRPLTTAVVDWQPAEWPTVGAAVQTGDISSVLQEIIDRPAWVSGNALAVIVNGSGRRVAESYDGNAPAAPLLHVEYLAGP